MSSGTIRVAGALRIAPTLCAYRTDLAITRASSAMSTPAMMRVVLNRRPERSSELPSALKCRCHHCPSDVVRIEAAMPSTMTAATLGSVGRANRRPTATGRRAATPRFALPAGAVDRASVDIRLPDFGALAAGTPD